MPAHLLARLRDRLLRRPLPVWYSPSYRLPLSGVEASAGIEPRRADFVAWWLVESGVIDGGLLRTPLRIPYADLDRVHTPELLESLSHPEALASIFAVDPSDVPVDELLATVRLACGGTLAAAREALAGGGVTLNLLGGFHHAGPGSAGGFCPLNDVAVAIAAVRADGFEGQVAVLDLDAHPPDGIGACVENDAAVWVGSLSGSDWGPLPRVDETVLPEGTEDEPYLESLQALLGRMPEAGLAFVLAGGDVLAGDRFGRLGLTLAGARRRDLTVARALSGVPSVWLPAGGYTSESWRVLAGTALALASGSEVPIPEGADPLPARFAAVAAGLSPEDLGELDFDTADMEEALGLAPRGGRHRLLLGYYTASGLEHAFHRYGVLEQLRRLGFSGFRVAFDAGGTGERLRLFGTTDGVEHVLVEEILERRKFGGREVLYIHWLNLRNPRARFSDLRPRLPGQEVPGLGMAREMGEILGIMARRLGLAAVVFRPAHFHTAYSVRRPFAFVVPERQGRFEALVRDLARLPLLEATAAVADGRVWLGGSPYTWEADEMAVGWEWSEVAQRDEAIRHERERCSFEVR